MAEQFLDELHNLNGKTLGEIFKKFNLLVKSHEQMIKQNIDEILIRLIPKTDLEKIFKIKLMDYCKCDEAILNILKSQDEFYISYALQCSWFFKNLKYSSSEFVNNIFSSMSHSTRLKVLKRYSKFLKDTSLADEFFIDLKKLYGLNLALIILPACSENLISNVLMNSNCQIHSSTLTIIYKNYPFIFINYLNHLLESKLQGRRIFKNFLIEYDVIFHNLVSKFPKEFLQMISKYSTVFPILKLGRKSSRSLFQKEFNNVIKNMDVCKRFLIWKNVVTVLNMNQIEEIFCSLLPKNIIKFCSSYVEYGCDYVSFLSEIKNKNYRQKILMNSLKKVYNKDLTDYISIINSKLIKELPIEIRVPWCELNLKNEDKFDDNRSKLIENKATVISNLNIDRSIPLLKQLIENESDVNSRAYIASCLFKTIIINDNLNFLGELCEYIVKRFRNDQNIVLEKILIELSNIQGLEKIKDDDWIFIEELMNIFILNNDNENFKKAYSGFHSLLKIMSIQILTKMKKDKPVEEYLNKYMKLNNTNYNFNLGEDSPFEKRILIWTFEYFSMDTSKKLFDDYDWLIVKLFDRLCYWNDKYKNDRITIPNWLFTKILIIFESKNLNYQQSKILESLKLNTELRHKFFHLIFPKYFDPNILLFILANAPDKIIMEVEEIMKKIYNSSESFKLFFIRSKFYSFINLPDVLTKFCLNILNCQNIMDLNIYNPKGKSIKFLSLLLPTNNFLNIISDFYPKETKIGDFSDEGREFYSIQKEIGECLKYVNEPSEVLIALKKFSHGDYLKLIVSSLNSICLRTPQNKILPLLQEWFDSPVSVRKHIFRAYIRIAPILSSLQMIQDIFDKEINYSLRLILFDSIFQLFIKNPSEESFLHLKIIINKLTPRDEEVIYKLYIIDKIPDEYISEYFQILWEYTKKNNLINKSLIKIIQMIDPDILIVLKNDICNELFKNIFKIDELDSYNCTLFIARYLLYNSEIDILTKRIEIFINTFQSLKINWNHFNLKNSKVFKSRQILFSIIESFQNESYNLNNKNVSLILNSICTLKLKLLSILKEEDIIEEIIILEILEFFHKEYNENNEEFINHSFQFIETLLKKYVSVYDLFIINMIYKIFKNSFEIKFSNDTILMNKQTFDLIQKLVNSSSRYNCIFGIKMLPININSDIDKYKNILDIIIQNEDLTVRLFVNKLFKNLSSSVKLDD